MGLACPRGVRHKGWQLSQESATGGSWAGDSSYLSMIRVLSGGGEGPMTEALNQA